MRVLFSVLLTTFLLFSCEEPPKHIITSLEEVAINDIKNRVEEYADFHLTTDLSHFSENQKKMLFLLIQASKVMDTLFNYQSYGNIQDKIVFSKEVYVQKLIEINQGPWDRLKNNEPFLEGIAEKAWGANFYPDDMSKKEFESSDFPGKDSHYTLIRRDSLGQLTAIPYHVIFKDHLSRAAQLLRQASKYSEISSFKTYLLARADALESDDFQKSDKLWMDMRDNLFDIIIGPIESYEDQLYHLKKAYSSFVLVKDLEWGKKIQHFLSLIPSIFSEHPFVDEYNPNKILKKVDINAYDIVYYAGDANVGKKTIAINLPNGEKNQRKMGVRNAQFKNVIHAKYDKILLPIVDVVLTEEQRQYLNFDSFFASIMFREIARSLDFNKDPNLYKLSFLDKLNSNYILIEELKNDAMQLFLIEKLIERKELKGDIRDYYTAFFVSKFRNIRFGTNNDFALSNVVCYNFFLEKGGFRRLSNGFYEIDYSKMSEISKAFLMKVLPVFAVNSKKNIDEIIEQYGTINRDLQADLFRFDEVKIPVDLYLKQGEKELNLLND